MGKRSDKLSTEDQALFARCEQEIDQRHTDFLATGTAFKIIRDQRLYRATHTQFEAYCQARWSLSRRGAYQKIECVETYDTVCHCTEMPPTNEAQLRQLRTLPTAALQQLAWQRAAALHRTTQQAMTAALVKAAVLLVKQAQAGAPLSAFLQADRTFPGIPYRWDVCVERADPSTGERQAVLSRLPRCAADAQVSAADETVPAKLVLVSPEVDLFTSTLPEEALQRIVAVMGGEPVYQFICWTASPERLRRITAWPSTAILAVRITTQAEWTRLQAIQKDLPSISAVWVVPGSEPIAITSPVPYSHVLLGEPTVTYENLLIATVASHRRLMAHMINGISVIHLTSAIHSLLCQASSMAPSKSYKVTVTKT